MTWQVRLRQGGGFSVQPDQTILEAGLAARFSFPHACRNGNCQRCLGHLASGSVHLERKNLTIHAGEAAASEVLYCLARPLADCEIDVPEVYSPQTLPTHEVSAQIHSIEPLSKDISRVMLTLPAGKPISWHAGQYLELLLDIGPCAFSIASPPGGRELELHVRHTADNPASLQIMDILRDAATVRIRLPGGQRFIDTGALPDKPVCFICGSTGFAPAKAMIETLLEADFPHRISLYWGARVRDDLYLHTLAQSWHESGKVDYVPVLSEQQDDAFRQGLVHQAALTDLDAPQQALFHIGGSPAMAWAVFDALRAAGVSAEQIHSDVYDYAPR